MTQHHGALMASSHVRTRGRESKCAPLTSCRAGPCLFGRRYINWKMNMKRLSIPATCRNGHPRTADSYYANGSCKQCHKTRAKRWRAKHAKADAAYNKQWKKEHATEEHTRQTQWRGGHKEQLRTAARHYYAEHAEERKAYSSNYVATNHAKVCERARTAYANHPEIHKARWHQRKALLLGNGGTAFTAHQWLELVVFYGAVCLRCTKHKPLTADHVIPLSRGGTNAIENIQPLCLACNCSKGVRDTDYRLLCLNPS